MERTNSLRIRAPRERIFFLASQVERWPEWLPHYRWVTVRRQLAPDRRIVEMAAHRDGIPVRWVALQGLQPREGLITFRHIGGPTTGMEVAWRLHEDGEGTVETSIYHHFAPAWPPVVGPFIARHVVGSFFISAIADRTLAQVKSLAENARAPGGVEWERYVAASAGQRAGTR
ncbi:MAG: hypothetical protein NVSMB65_09690 [Chloroflexota bacterium]